MKKAIVLFFLFFVQTTILAQHEADNWIFGQHAGITFSGGSPVSISSEFIPMYTLEGCASMSSASGDLLFYVGSPNPSETNLTVWQSDHTIMPGGENLIGDVSSAQAAIIVPNPNSSSIYYVFTLDRFQSNASNNRGLYYYTIDMSLDGGMGAVIDSGTQLLTYAAEKITAVKSGDFYWVVAYSSLSGAPEASSTFHSFKITAAGVNATSVTSPNGPSGSYFDGRGFLKFNPQGNKIAISHAAAYDYNGQSGRVLIYDFNNDTGQISNGYDINIVPGYRAYGIEFSLQSKKFYIVIDDDSTSATDSPHQSLLWQYDLESADVPNSGINIDVQNNRYRGALQLGPDGKIYRALPKFYSADDSNAGTHYLGVVHSPELDGLACNYEHNGLDLGTGISHQGLPPFIQSIFITEITYEGTCSSSPFSFHLSNEEDIVAIEWGFGDGTPLLTGEISPNHIFPDAGPLQRQIQ